MENNIVISEEVSGDMFSFLPDSFKNLINNIEEVPSIIVEQTDSLDNFAKKQQEAIEAAMEAKEAADSAKAKEVKLLSGKKVAIEALQETCAAQSSALMNLAAAIQAAFNHQEKIKEITDLLLGIGFMNTALNRMVVRELELRLKNASEKELSDLARKELENVVRQLKAQQDMAQRIENQKVSLERNEKDITTLNLELSSLNQTVNQMFEDIKKTTTSALSDLNIKREADSSFLRKQLEQKKASIDQEMDEHNKKIQQTIQKLLHEHHSAIKEGKQQIENGLCEFKDLFEDIKKTTTSALSDLNVKREADSSFLRKQLEQKKASIDQEMDEHNKKIQQTMQNLLQEYNSAIKEGKQQIEDGLCEIKDLFENALDSLLEQSQQFEKGFSLFKAESKKEAENMSREMRQKYLDFSSKQEEQYISIRKRERIILYIVIFVLAISVITSFFAFRTP